jgi:4-amino-4-deoxy-L-arabinose transferase-like glycosyltransferase
MPIVAALTAIGVALRLVVAHQSLFADELSTRYIVAGRGLTDVVSIVHTDAEITPPLYFVSSWLTTRIDLTPELLRAPSLLAGAATIPLVYLLALRTVGRRAALVAAALTTFSPFMVYYSAEARGYALMMALVLGATLCLLTAVEHGRARWWAGYAACTCAAVYTHYTSVFALAGLLGWALWAHPQARRGAILATAVAVVGFLPWLSGLKGDLDSPTTDILSALQPFVPGYVRSSLVHWSIAFPYLLPGTRVSALPGVPALLALALALVLGLGAFLRSALRRRLRPPDRRLVLVIVLAVSVPAGEALVSAVGSNLFGARNLAAAWPAFAICLAALLVAAGPRLGLAAAALAIGAFAVAGLKMLDGDFQRPQYDAAITFVNRNADPGDVVIDGVSLTPGGIPSVVDLAFAGRRRVYDLGRSKVRYDPFRILGGPPPTADVIRRAAAAARGGRLFMLLAPTGGPTREALAAIPAGYRRVTARTYDGINRIEVVVMRTQTASGA